LINALFIVTIDECKMTNINFTADNINIVMNNSHTLKRPDNLQVWNEIKKFWFWVSDYLWVTS